jgi:ribonucleotide reductase alpha subunit
MNSANESTGSIHWMKFIDSIGYYVGQKGRIPAMLFSLSCSHPDIEDFIKIKSDYTSIQNANISVQCLDAFYDAVKKDADWHLTFEIPEVKKGDRIYIDSQSKSMDAHFDREKKKWYTIANRDRKGEAIEQTIKARYLMELIAKNMHANAEPGIQNIDVARKYSNSDYVYNPEDEYDSRIVSTNACCIVADSKIMTNEGWLSIKEIYDRYCAGNKSLLAMSYNIANKQYELKPILNAWQQRNDPTVELLIEEGGKQYKLECSADHKILTKNRGYVESASLTIDDDIMIFG